MQRSANSSLVLQSLAGDLEGDGYRLSLWKGRSGREQRLDEALRGEALVFALSLGGTTQLGWGGTSVKLGMEQALMLGGKTRPIWTATGGHRLLWLEISPEIIREMGGGLPVRQEVETLLNGNTSEGLLGPFTVGQDILSLAQQLIHAPSHLVSLPVWYRAKVMELAALWFYSPQTVQSANNGPTEKVRTGRELVQRALFLLERDLENPPGLEILAQELGCSVFQLSRLFTAHTGCSMPQHLRRKRMERAASLLHTTRLGVSEVSLAVGYTSFSAFTRAFVRELGETPTGFRLKRI